MYPRKKRVAHADRIEAAERGGEYWIIGSVVVDEICGLSLLRLQTWEHEKQELVVEDLFPERSKKTIIANDSAGENVETLTLIIQVVKRQVLWEY